jgi:sec-independent protein translocase protein TatA
MSPTLLGMLNTPEIILLLVLALVLFGAKKLPELARGLGHGIKEFKKATRDVQDELHSAINIESPSPLPPSSPPVPEPLAAEPAPPASASPAEAVPSVEAEAPSEPPSEAPSEPPSEAPSEPPSEPPKA